MSRVTSSPMVSTGPTAQRRAPSIMPGPDSVLHLTEVTFRRGPAILLDALNWNVDVDDRWVILGPNGAGKTTLLQIASGQMFPTSGRVHILGERLGAVDVTEIRTRIGLSSAALAGSGGRGEPVAISARRSKSATTCSASCVRPRNSRYRGDSGSERRHHSNSNTGRAVRTCAQRQP